MIDDYRVLCSGGYPCEKWLAIREMQELYNTWRRQLRIATCGKDGYDDYVQEWASFQRIDYRIYFPQFWLGRRCWTELHKRMLAQFQPHMVLAFPGIHRDLVARARKQGIKIVMATS